MRKPFALACTLALAFTLGCDSGDDDDGGDDETGGGDRVSTILGLTGDAAAGQAPYAANCGIDSCHGADGTASMSTNSTDITGASAMAMATSSIDGVLPNMPSQSFLSDQELADIIAYVMTL